MFGIFVIVIPFLVWLLWAKEQGTEEGIYTIAKQCNPNKKLVDMHKRWTIQRTFVGIIALIPLIVFSLFENVNIWILLFNLFLLSVALILSFPFIHDGWFFMTCNKFEDEKDEKPYPDGFWQNKDGKAKFDFTVNQRIIMFALSCSVIFFLSLVSVGGLYQYSGMNMMGVDLLIVGIAFVGVIVYFFRNGFPKKKK